MKDSVGISDDRLGLSLRDSKSWSHQLSRIRRSRCAVAMPRAIARLKRALMGEGCWLSCVNSPQ